MVCTIVFDIAMCIGRCYCFLSVLQVFLHPLYPDATPADPVGGGRLEAEDAGLQSADGQLVRQLFGGYGQVS